MNDLVLSFSSDEKFILEKRSLEFRFFKNNNLKWNTLKIKLKFGDQILESVEDAIKMETKIWGYFHMDEVLVECYYPFFMFRTWKYLKLDQDIYVLPSGEKNTNIGHEADSSPSIRPFIEGDLYSKINWKKSRDGKLITNILESHNELGNHDFLVIDESILDFELEAQQIREILLKIDFLNLSPNSIKRKDGSLLSRSEVANIVRGLVGKVKYVDG